MKQVDIYIPVKSLSKSTVLKDSALLYGISYDTPTLFDVRSTEWTAKNLTFGIKYTNFLNTARKINTAFVNLTSNTSIGEQHTTTIPPRSTADVPNLWHTCVLKLQTQVKSPSLLRVNTRQRNVMSDYYNDILTNGVSACFIRENFGCYSVQVHTTEVSAYNVYGIVPYTIAHAKTTAVPDTKLTFNPTIRANSVTSDVKGSIGTENFILSGNDSTGIYLEKGLYYVNGYTQSNTFKIYTDIYSIHANRGVLLRGSYGNTSILNGYIYMASRGAVIVRMFPEKEHIRSVDYVKFTETGYESKPMNGKYVCLNGTNDVYNWFKDYGIVEVELASLEFQYISKHNSMGTINNGPDGTIL